jgi:hypothetical protein
LFGGANGRELSHWLSAPWRREQLNGADTAPFGRGCASLAPLVGQNDDLIRPTQENEPQSIKTKIEQTAKGAVVIFPKSGVQLISRPLCLRNMIICLHFG